MAKNVYHIQHHTRYALVRYHIFLDQSPSLVLEQHFHKAIIDFPSQALG